MEKNTIWAIILSTIVIIAAFAIQPIFLNKNNVTNQSTTEVSEITEQDELIEVETELKESEEIVEQKSTEEFFTIKTNLVEATFTNKGGDIVSYQLLNHFDKATNSYIELMNNISATNRACSIALGNVDNAILNDFFDVEIQDENTILFKKKFIKNGNAFTLGKRYTFKPNEYIFKLDILIHSDSGIGLDFNNTAYTLRTSPQIGPHFDQKENRYENRQFVTYNGNKYKRIILSTNQFKKYDNVMVWAGIAGKYFVELVIPENADNIKSMWYSSRMEDGINSNAQALIERVAFNTSDVQDTYYLYFGPRNDKDLKRYNIEQNNDWEIGGKKVNNCLQTSGWLNWLEIILKFIMEKLYLLIPNWGVTIIILTILLKVLMFPISKKQSLSTLKMQEIQPKLELIQKKYKDNPQKLQAEMQNLYKEAGYNPASGCLPMIFQFLVLFAMYNLFNNYFEFRGAEFIPKWIPDLSVGDSIYTFKFSIPFIGNKLRLLPIIYVITQLLFGKITQNGGLNSNAQNASSMKFMTYGMPLIFFFLFYNAPSGLLLYWTVSNIFQIGQQLIINKIMAEKKAEIKTTNTNKKLPPKAKK